MLISIFKPLEDPMKPTYFQQKFIKEDDPVPEGWIKGLSTNEPQNVTINPNARSANITAE